MARFGDRLRKLTEQFNLGNLGEAKQGFDRGFAPASEDARSVLYKYRESLGLDEPPQAAEVVSRSGMLQALRDGLTAQGAPDPIGFGDRMLKERLEVGQSILDDPTIFQRALDAELDKRKAIARREIEESLSSKKKTLADYGVNDDFGGEQSLNTFIDQIELDKEAERKVINDTAKEVKRLMKEESVLKKLGYNLGAIAGDINEDRSRSLYWLLNAPQAITSTTADLLMSEASPNLRTMRSITRLDLKRAEEQGLLRRIGDEPLTLDQRLKLEAEGLINPGEQGLAESIYLNVDNFEPAKPGIRRKYDPEVRNVLKKEGKTGNKKGSNKGDTVFGQRRISPSTLAFMGLGGTALATNAGLGLTGTEEVGVPLVGRREGYAAASPDELDPRKSNNAAFEYGTRYLLSRDGRMLPKEDFLLERPDVSSQQYSDYNAYSFGKDLDFNPFDDGKANMGIIKLNADGIHGAEAQILGQTLSLNEAGIPILGAMGGMAAGALLPNIRQVRLKNQKSTWEPGKGRRGMIKNILGYLPEVRRKRYDREKDTNPNNPLLKNKTIDRATQAVEDFFLETNPVTGKLDMNQGRVVGALGAGTFGGVALGTLIGLEREDRRRRENFEELNPGIDYDVYKKNARNLLDQKYELMASDPNRTEKLNDSRAGFSRVKQEESLMRYMQEQQAVIDQVADAYIKGQMKDAMNKQEWAAQKLEQIKQERNKTEEEEPYPIFV